MVGVAIYELTNLKYLNLNCWCTKITPNGMKALEESIAKAKIKEITIKRIMKPSVEIRKLRKKVKE
jgi:hypothetical protein